MYILQEYQCIQSVHVQVERYMCGTALLGGDNLDRAPKATSRVFATAGIWLHSVQSLVLRYALVLFDNLRGPAVAECGCSRTPFGSPTT